MSRKKGSGVLCHFSSKVCVKCGLKYQPTSGNQKYCAKCLPAVNDERYKANNARCYSENAEREKERAAKWRREHPEKVKEESARWRASHLDQAREAYAQWREKNPERTRELSARRRREHPEDWIVGSSKRREAKYANTPIGELLTSAEWLAIIAEANGHCHYCGKEAKLTLDHVIPLSRGGKHSKGNVVPACLHCNDSKGSKTLEEWHRSRHWAKVLLSQEAA